MDAMAVTRRTIGPWRVGAPLGAGAVGAVYEAREVRQPYREAAIKILHQRVALLPMNWRRFAREVQALRRAEHENIVRLLDSGQSADGLRYLVMERLRGRPLSALLRAAPLPLSQVLDLGVQVAAALVHAHRLGIVHRDIKPDNLMLLPEGRVKVLDFGVAKLLSDPAFPSRLTATGQTIGTSAYMPPEQLHGEPVDTRADIYALGVVLFQCLSGRLPYDAAGLVEVALAQRDGEAPLLVGPRLPRDVGRLLQRMLARAPAGRPQTMAEVAGDLEALRQRLAMGVMDAPTQLESAALTRINDAERGAPGRVVEVPVGSSDEAVPWHHAPEEQNPGAAALPVAETRELLLWALLGLGVLLCVGVLALLWKMG